MSGYKKHTIHVGDGTIVEVEGDIGVFAPLDPGETDPHGPASRIEVRRGETVLATFWKPAGCYPSDSPVEILA